MEKRLKLSLISINDDHGQMSKKPQDGSNKVKDKSDADTIAWVSLE